MTRDRNPMSAETANAVYDVLVAQVGASASDDARREFLHHQIRSHMTEFRFCGRLGMGGKFYRNRGVRPDGTYGSSWYVTCYPEHLTPERQAAIDATAAPLDALRIAHEEAHAATEPKD